jgi:biotin synthase-related radical SAM superfamily protein
MRCSLALVWDDNETGKAEAILEMPEAEFRKKLIEECLSILDHPTLWERIKRIFRPAKYELSLTLKITELIQDFKDGSNKAHLGKFSKRMVDW